MPKKRILAYNTELRDLLTEDNTLLVDVIKFLNEKLEELGPDANLEKNNYCYECGNGGFSLIGFRDETDKEFQARLIKERKQKEKAETQRLKQEAQKKREQERKEKEERELFEKLKKKFG